MRRKGLLLVLAALSAVTLPAVVPGQDGERDARRDAAEEPTRETPQASPGEREQRRRARQGRRRPRGRRDSVWGQLSSIARGGRERALLGSPAPDFALPRLEDVEQESAADGPRDQRLVRLSSLRGRPVVLIFGSYT